VAVRIRMKKLGRRHRPYFRICAMDSKAPRDGRALEELGTYDPMIPETDARVTLNNERIAYWMGVGALPSENVAVFIKKYGPEGTHLEKQKAAIEKLNLSRKRADFTPAPSPAKVAAAAAEAAEAEPTEAPAADAPATEEKQAE